VTPKQRAVMVIGLISGMPAAFLAGRAVRAASAPRVASGERLQLSADRAVSNSGPREVLVARRKAPPRSVPQLAASPAPAQSTLTSTTSRPTDAVVARQVVEALLAQVGTESAIRNPVDATAMKRAFLSGWLDGVRYTSSTLLDGIGVELRDRLCLGVPNDAEGMFIGHILQMAPQIATSEGFQCYFSRPPSDIVALATMLEAWRNSQLEMVPALEHIKNTMQDSRIQSVFAPPSPDQEPELGP
jgi:hypothetical protein